MRPLRSGDFPGYSTSTRYVLLGSNDFEIKIAMAAQKVSYTKSLGLLACRKAVWIDLFATLVMRTEFSLESAMTVV